MEGEDVEAMVPYVSARSSEGTDSLVEEEGSQSGTKGTGSSGTKMTVQPIEEAAPEGGQSDTKGNGSSSSK